MLLPSERQDFVFNQSSLVKVEKELVEGAELCLTSTVCSTAPAPQARDRLWGCRRADYRPVPLGVDAILALSILFYLRDLRWGVGMHGRQG